MFNMQERRNHNILIISVIDIQSHYVLSFQKYLQLKYNSVCNCELRYYLSN